MKLVTNNFRTHMAKQFIESLNEASPSVYFIGAHRSLPYANNVLVPEPLTSVAGTHYDLYDELIFGKRVFPGDAVHMIRRINWVSGTVYDMYDDQVQDLDQKNFYVVSSETGGDKHVFKCLYNNNGGPSTVMPVRSATSPTDELYVTTEDNYQWKYMYTITPTQWTKFATPDYIPVFVDSAVTAAAVAGAIDKIVVEDPGLDYLNYATGNIREAAIAGDPLYFALESDGESTLSSVDGFYENSLLYIDSGPGDGQARLIIDYFVSNGQRRVLIDRPFDVTPTRASTFKIAPRVAIQGDGQGAEALVEIDTVTRSVKEIFMVSRGTGYTYADIEILASPAASASNLAVARAIISPPGGHGKDVVGELFGTKVGVSVTFDKSEANTIPTTNDYRKISIIKDPKFAFANFTLDGDSPLAFNANEVVTQQSTGATATVSARTSLVLTLSDIVGFFEVSNTSPLVGQTSGASAMITDIDRSFNTFDQRTIIQGEILDDGLAAYNGFVLDELVVQEGLLSVESTVGKLRIDVSALKFSDGETITQESTGSSAKIIGRGGFILQIDNITGAFDVGSSIVGSTSKTVANVEEFDVGVRATAVGNVHETITLPDNNLIIALTNVNGTFVESDDSTNTINTLKGQKSQTVAKIIDIATDNNRLVDDSGEILYVENLSAITRDPDQKERIKLIIGF